MQIPLPVRLLDENSFANFLPHPGARLAVAHLREGLAHRPLRVFLHGAPGAGRSHLLQACCHALEAESAAFVYLPLGELRELPPADLLAGLEERALLCLDDLDAVAGRGPWEEALFHLFNRVQAREGSLLVAARQPPSMLGIALPDLRSRLQSLSVFALAAPDDAALAELLTLRARGRGLQMEPEVARYILQRASRSPPDLIALLERLDAQSLAAARRLSIPFVREVLGWQA